MHFVFSPNLIDKLPENETFLHLKTSPSRRTDDIGSGMRHIRPDQLVASQKSRIIARVP